MHCPRCGQQQVTEEIKFCSRCGFPLGLISEILAHDGDLPQLAGLSRKKKWLTRNFGFKLAVLWFFIITFLLVPLAAITYAPAELVAGLAIIGFCGGLLLTVLSFLFLTNESPLLSSRGSAPNEFATAPSLAGRGAPGALPPQTSEPVSNYAPPAAGQWKAPETGELVPNSVTEGTTKLLQKED
jgi:hypothetical protein